MKRRHEGVPELAGNAKGWPGQVGSPVRLQGHRKQQRRLHPRAEPSEAQGPRSLGCLLNPNPSFGPLCGGFEKVDGEFLFSSRKDEFKQTESLGKEFRYD